MNNHARTLTRTAMVIAGLFLLSACATTKAPEAPLDSRVKLTALQADSTLATRAPVEMREAEAAVRAAEAEVSSRPDSEYARHLVLMADQKVEIARARAQSRQYEDQRRALSEESERARLDARTLEADRAHRDAQSARAMPIPPGRMRPAHATRSPPRGRRAWNWSARSRNSMPARPIAASWSRWATCCSPRASPT
jgi:hypothetical protein